MYIHSFVISCSAKEACLHCYCCNIRMQTISRDKLHKSRLIVHLARFLQKLCKGMLIQTDAWLLAILFTECGDLQQPTRFFAYA